MKKTLLLLAFFSCSLLGFAQNEILVQSSDKGLTIAHTVSPKETFYSIGRLYNISPKDIAAYNSLDMNNGLSIGQVVQVPLTNVNFSQSGTNGRPLYYVVGEKEGLYRVSLKHNKVLMADLRKWNNLTSDALSTGQRLIVGYLVSPEAGNIVASQPQTAAPVQTTTAPVQEARRQETTARTETPRTERRNDPPARQAANTSSQVAVSDNNGGYFKSHFEQQSRSASAGKEQTVTSGIFKTASGWQDAKYYALMDGVEPGTIVRVINPTNNKAIYAKVLGQMSGIRQNEGYGVRISNAAASVLEINDTDKFIVRVNY